MSVSLGYAASHHPGWREELRMPDLPYGAFAENFTISFLNARISPTAGECPA